MVTLDESSYCEHVFEQSKSVCMCEILFVKWRRSEVLPRDEPRARPPPRGLGIPPLPARLLGLLLLPGNRLCVGDVGDLTSSVVFGRADRLSGCVPSSYGSRDRSKTEDRYE